MAATVAAIKDETILAQARTIVKTNEEFRSEHHCNLLWRLMRELGFGKKVMTKEELEQAAKTWVSFYDNGSLGYSSNCAKRLAESGVCAKSANDRARLEYV